MVTSKGKKHTVYLDRKWHLLCKTIGSLDFGDKTDNAKVIIDHINKTLTIKREKAKASSKKDLRRKRKKIKNRESRLQKLILNLKKHEKNSFIRSYYLKKIDTELIYSRIVRIKASQRLSEEEKNKKIHEFFSSIFPLPSEEERSQFILEFIAFLRFLKDSNKMPKSDLNEYFPLYDPDFYGIEGEVPVIDFSRSYTDFKTYRNHDLEITYSAKEIEVIFRKVLSNLNIHKKIQIKIRPTRLFSVSTATKTITIPKRVYITQNRLKKLIFHEIFVHLYRSVLGYENQNNQNKKLQLLQTGLVTNLAVEEGIATFFEQNALYDSTKYDLFALYNFYMRLITVHFALTFEPYEWFHKLDLLCRVQSHIFEQSETEAEKNRDMLIIRAHKGLISPQKGCVNGRIAQYLMGNRMIWEFTEEGGQINHLFAGKIGMDDLSMIPKLGFSIPDTLLGERDFPREKILQIIFSALR